MATGIAIGGGINIGGGISVGSEAAPSGTLINFGEIDIDTYNIGTEYGWRSGIFGAATQNSSPFPGAFSGVWYDSANVQTYIQSINGNYTSYSPNGTGEAFAFTVTDTAINGSATLKVSIDEEVTYITSASAQKTVGGVIYVFTGDPLGLEALGSFNYLQINDIAYVDNGQTRTVAAGSFNPTEDGQDPTQTGYINGVMGSTNILPNLVESLYYSTTSSTTTVQFLSGTYSDGSVVISSTQINGSTAVVVTVDGVVQSGTLVSGASGAKLTVAGDVFSLVAKANQTLDVLVVGG